MQCACIEFARNVIGLEDANSEEFDKNTPNNIIYLMKEWYDFRTKKTETRCEESEKGGTMRLGSYPCKLKKGTVAYEAYKTEKIDERHRHRFEYNNKLFRSLRSTAWYCPAQLLTSPLWKSLNCQIILGFWAVSSIRNSSPIP